MAWQSTQWACGHTGTMQLYGKHSGRDSRVAYEAGRDCMACWLVGQWEASNDPRSKREDRYKLASDIAEGKGKRITVDAIVPIKVAQTGKKIEASDADLIAELKARGLQVANG